MSIHHDAFLSYSHSTDGRLAPALEAALEKLARLLFRLRAIDVFRDQTSLAANPGLWASIVEHLAGSRWFLLMASPASAASPWCNQEVQWWLEHRGVDRLLVVLTDGHVAWDAGKGDFDWSATSALSASLRGRFAGEPLYVDLCWAHQQEKLTLSDSRFRDAVLDLAAPIHEVPKDQLDGEDVRQLRRTRWLARAAWRRSRPRPSSRRAWLSTRRGSAGRRRRSGTGRCRASSPPRPESCAWPSRRWPSARQPRRRRRWQYRIP